MNAPPARAPVESPPDGYRRRAWIAWLAFAIALAFTLLSWRHALDSTEREAELRFDALTQDVHEAIQARMVGYEKLLHGGAAFFAGSQSVGREAWKKYVEALHIQQHFPGIQGVGFAQYVAASERETHIRAIRAEGYPDYSIHPAGERSAYTAIVYLEPFSGRNLRAFGYDMFAEPTRRAAMEHARDGGETSLSGKVILIQEAGQDPQAGFLMYMPVYRSGAPQGSTAERRAALFGYVYAAFRMNDLMRALPAVRAPRFGLKIYDGTEISPAALMYDDSRHDADPPRRVRELRLDTGGRSWTLRLTSTPEFESDVTSLYPRAILVGGMALTGLILLLSLALLALRKQASVLVASQAELRQSRERLDFLVSAAPVVIYAAQAHGDFGTTFVSANVRTQLGHDPAEFTASPGFWASHIHPQDRERVFADLPALFEAGEHTHEYRFAHKDDSWRWMRDAAVLTRDAAGAPLEIVGYWIDITKEHRAEEAIQGALRMKTEFMTNVTHELRTPLNSVIGFAELLHDQVPGPLNARQTGFAADILASGQRLLALVEGILEMSRLDAAETSLEREAVDVGAALAARAAAHHALADAHGVSISLELAPDLGDAELDPRALRRMLDALIDNAIKFNREGGRVTLSARRAGDWLEIAVADSGSGIAGEDLAKLFQPLVQLDAGLARRAGGIGLGLALARRLAELHGGTIEVQSEPGQGSSFTLRLPMKEKT